MSEPVDDPTHDQTHDQIHDDEADTCERVVRSLLAEQCPQWADSKLTSLSSTGTSNALWRLHLEPGQPDCIVRLPRTPSAEPDIVNETQLLPVLATKGFTHASSQGQTGPPSVVQVPEVLHRGRPSDAFAMRWLALGWIDGQDAWSSRHSIARAPADLAVDLAQAIQSISSLEIDSAHAPIPDRAPGNRGGPLRPLLEQLDRWLGDPHWSADQLIDTEAVRRSADQSSEVVDEPVTIGFVHGDLLPGNILVKANRLQAIIDWGGAGRGDLAQDLTPAWAIFDHSGRDVLRRELGVDDATWLRGRAFELEHAVGAVLYYKPRNHPLAEVQMRTLERILSDSMASS
ncbi:MAG: phosphotransferase [Acidimicrobiales bacterium]